MADFHLGWWCDLAAASFDPKACAKRARQHLPEFHPEPTTAYFRWTWAELEPMPGVVDFARIDRAIQAANELGEVFAFRVTLVGDAGPALPAWLTESSDAIAGQWRAASGEAQVFWPDYRDASLQSAHARFVSALAERYDGHPSLDHVDIGAVGCWGEWNTACLAGEHDLFNVYAGSKRSTQGAAIETPVAAQVEIAESYQAYIEHYVDQFVDTPLVIPALGAGSDAELSLLIYALERGSGWRLDCWGDWGIFSPNWSHQASLYPKLFERLRRKYPAFDQVWQHAPVELEVCATMATWADSKGWQATKPNGLVHKSFAWAHDLHASVLNLKRRRVPQSYRAGLDELLDNLGPKLGVIQLTLPQKVQAGTRFTLESVWQNRGQTPIYARRDVMLRLDGPLGQIAVRHNDIAKHWPPGQHRLESTFELPKHWPAGQYSLQVALIDRPGQQPKTNPLPPWPLENRGRQWDGFYTLATIQVESSP